MWGRALTLTWIVALGGWGCGYRFLTPGSTFPGGVRTVAVPVFTNTTSEPGLEALLTGLVREHVLRAGRLANGTAEATLEGTVLGLSSSQPVLAVQGRTTYRVGLSLQLVLRKGGAVVGQATASGAEDYPAGADVLWTETHRSQALQRLAEQLAREALDRLAAGS